MDILDISVVRGGQMGVALGVDGGLVIGFGDKEIRFRSFVVTSGDVILFVKGLDPFILLVGLRVECLCLLFANLEVTVIDREDCAAFGERVSGPEVEIQDGAIDAEREDCLIIVS